MLEKLNNQNLLFLEDDLEFIKLASEFFDMFFKNVFIAHTIEEAKEILKNKKIDMIVSDIHLENENGLDFIKDVRAKNDTIPIAILSGHKDEKLLLSAIPLNLCGYLLKPLNYKSVLDVLLNCIRKIDFNSNYIFELKNGFFYDKNLKIVKKDDETFDLNEKEILFFEIISENINKVITKEILQYTLWKNDKTVTEAAVNNFILRIRKRFGKDFLHTIANVGYKVVI